MPPRILVLNGPNLNLLGRREPSMYGAESLADIERLCRAAGDRLGASIDFRQTNHEGALVDWVQEAGESADGLVLNAGAYTHTSVAIHDALRAAKVPTIEVHLSNVFAREAFRHHSYVSELALGVICGFGAKGYEMALEAMAHHLAARSSVRR